MSMKFNNGGYNPATSSLGAQINDKFWSKVAIKEARRKRAAMITKKKSVTVTQKKFDPLELEGDDLDNFVNELIAGKK